MSFQSMNQQLKQYQTVATQAAESATPYQLIQMLLKGAMDKIALAKGCMERGQKGPSGELIGKSIAIVDNLRVSLDTTIDTEVTGQLEALYDYMARRLLHANLKQDVQVLDEVSALLGSIKDAWDAIPEEHRDAHTRKDQYLKNHSTHSR